MEEKLGLAGYFRTLLDYCYWSRDRILAAIDGMSEEEYAAPRELDHPSLRATLVHVFAAEALWRQRWQGHRDARALTEEQVPTLGQLRTLWSLEEAKVREFVKGLADADLTRDVVFTSSDGARRSEPLWQSMTQLVTHGVQHKSELALVLTRMGRSPGFMDFLAHVREARG